MFASRILAAASAILTPLGCASDGKGASEPGFVALFDGRTLAGWVTRGGRYDGDAAWSVEDGAIVGRTKDGEGGLLYTARPYTDFVLRLEARTDWPFDSGIFLRMAPGGKGAQVTLDTRDDGEVGAIYSDGFLQHNQGGVRLWKRDDWNDIEVRCSGEPMRIEVRLNGSALVDHAVSADLAGFVPTGLIGLQVHGDRADPPHNAVRFRNVRLCDLAPTSGEMFTHSEDGRLQLTPWGIANGWRSLFDGASLAGWEVAGGAGGWKAEGGILAALVEGQSSELRTVQDYGDFELRLDFKIAEMANSGVFLHGDRAGGDPAWSGCEVQILDDFHWQARTGRKLQPWQFTGSLYGSAAPGSKALKPLGEWNTLAILSRGTRIATTLNGTQLYDVDARSVAVPSGQKPLAERLQPGFIGLQRHAPEGVQGEAYAWFRNLFVRAL